ncbi:alpha/beta fold hydrolase [Bacillales bacterium AN1005]
MLHTANGHYVEVEENVTLYVEDVGEGKPVVFVHGMPVNHRIYEYQQSVLPQHGIRFIGIDLRGYGRSDHPLNGYTYDRMADDIKAVIDQLNLNDVTLAGFSMGGGVVTRYMGRHRGYKVSKLMLFGAATLSKLPEEAVNGLIAGLQTDRPQMLTNMFKGFFHTLPSQGIENWLWHMGMEANVHATIETVKAIGSEDLRSDLEAIRVPTLMLHGVHDQVCPFSAAEQAHEIVSTSKLVRFENSGHAPFYEEKEKFNREVIEFVLA